MTDSRELTVALKTEAARLGCAAVGICRAEVPQADIESLHSWLSTGCAAGMKYIAQRQAAYENLDLVMPDAKSVIMVAVPYETVGRGEKEKLTPMQGSVARYARGERDYHDVVRAMLKQIGSLLREHCAQAHTRAIVDTAPLLERSFACQAGLGGFGKNTTLINKRLGSRFFLGGLLTDIVLDYDQKAERNAPCGECRRCLDACPTGALVSPYTLDARLCLNYWMIEADGLPPEELRKKFGNRVFGCDTCQDVCPLNAGEADVVIDPVFETLEKIHPIDLLALCDLDEIAFKDRFGRTPIARSRRSGLLRNAAIVLGGKVLPEAAPVLVQSLSDESATVRATCAWALGQYDSEEVRRALGERLAVEKDTAVRGEINRAIEGH